MNIEIEVTKVEEITTKEGSIIIRHECYLHSPDTHYPHPFQLFTSKESGTLYPLGRYSLDSEPYIREERLRFRPVLNSEA